MATGIVQPSIQPPAPPVPGESVERDRLIQRQLARASLYLRLVDLAGGLAVWLIGVLLLFIAAAAFDHWIGLGTIGRFAALTVLLGGSLWFLAMHVAPLVIRAINPTYAAWTIEAASPSLKNSLINFMLLRQDKAGIREIVYQAVEKQAAADITSIPVETTVDRTRLIHAGYCLCAVMAIFAAYKILSPKDPFQTVARVLAPSATIARPSRVQISEIEPGNAEVYHGQRVRIEATIRGLRGKDRFHVHYTTTDGQIVDQPVEMKLAAGDRYECLLPPGDASAHALAGGLQQNVSYRLVAGDAESQSFRLTVLSSPTIIIDRLEYEFPAYTKKPPETIRQQGDIKAIEGTQVTLHAVANQPIRTAWLEMDPAANAGSSELVNMTTDGDRARGKLTLLLRPDRQTPWHGSYQVRFHNQRSEKSEQPIQHKIEVIRDLSPEVQILQPDRIRVEVPEDGELTISVRAVDPDFGLSSLRLEGAAAGKPPIAVSLLEDPTSQPPQAAAQYVIRPREHQLSAGNELTYAAIAEDNRANPRTNQPEPNITRTKDYKLVVTAAKSQNQQSGKAGKTDAQKQPGEQRPQDKSKQPQANQKQPPNQQKSDQPPSKSRDAEKEPGQRENEKTSSGDNQKSDSKKSDSQKAEKQQQKQHDQQQSGGNEQQQPSGQQQSGNQNSGQSGQQQAGEQQPGEQQSGQQQSGQQQGGQQQSGQQQSGQQQSGDQQQGGQQQGGQQQGGQQQPGSATSDGGASQKGQPNGQPQPSAGAEDAQGKAEHDGQAIERLFKELQKRQRESAEQSGDPAGQNQSEGAEQGGQPQSAGQSGQQNAGSANAGRPEPNDQRPQGDNEKQSGGQKSGNSTDRQPDDKQGQNPSEQQSGGSKGGAPQGASKTDKGEKSKSGQGEKRDAGAGDNGDEGAGQASDDKTASGPGARKNADRNKEQQPDSDKPESSEASNQSDSKRQSDSKGGQSGPQSGGGAKGGGQSAGQEGNDSAGSKSAADQGAGKANETGGGETGTKAGDQQQAGGQTGKSGNEKGSGTASRPGSEQAGKGQSEPSGNPSPDQNEKAVENQPKSGGQTGDAPVGGSDDGRERRPPAGTPPEDLPPDEANLEYARKATEMVLRRLKEEEHNPDPDLLDKLGWTREDLTEFLRRWEALEKSATQSPAGKRELDEALRSLGLRDPNTRRRAGGNVADKQRDLRDAGNRNTAPPRYRDLFDAFRKGAARSQ